MEEAAPVELVLDLRLGVEVVDRRRPSKDQAAAVVVEVLDGEVGRCPRWRGVAVPGRVRRGQVAQAGDVAGGVARADLELVMPRPDLAKRDGRRAGERMWRGGEDLGVHQYVVAERPAVGRAVPRQR